MTENNTHWSKNIVLTGFMGAGKSTLAAALSEHCRLLFVDTDELIVQRFGMSVADIFTQLGEPVFRQAETETLILLNSCREQVIATGGGMVLKEENRTLMQSIGPIVFLQASEEQLKDRLGVDTGRPLADGASWPELLARYQQRLPLYRQADLIIQFEQQSLEQLVSEVVTGLEKIDPTWKF